METRRSKRLKQHEPVAVNTLEKPTKQKNNCMQQKITESSLIFLQKVSQRFLFGTPNRGYSVYFRIVISRYSQYLKAFSQYLKALQQSVSESFFAEDF